MTASRLSPGHLRLAVWLLIVCGMCAPTVHAATRLRGAKAAAGTHRPLEPQDITAPGGMMPWAQLGFHPRGFPNSGPLPGYSPAMLRRLIPQYTRLQLPLNTDNMPPTPYQQHQQHAIRQLSFGTEVLPDKRTPYQLSLLRSGVEGGIPRSVPAEFLEVGRRLAHQQHHQVAREGEQFPSLGGLTSGLKAAASAAVSKAVSKAVSTAMSVLPKSRKPPGAGTVPPLGDRPPPPDMKEPPATNRGTDKDPAALASKFRFDHDEVFGSLDDTERRPPAPFPPTRFKPIPMAGSGTGVGSDAVAAKVPQPLMPMVWRQRPDIMPWATAVPGNNPDMVQSKVTTLKRQDKGGPFDEVYAQ